LLILKGQRFLKRAFLPIHPGDATYARIENQLASFTTLRDALAAQILALLEAAEFNNQPIPDQQAASLIQQANALLSNVQAFASNP
jgi:hypothetical protein